MKNTTLLIAFLLFSTVQPLSAHNRYSSISDSLLSARAFIDSGEKKYDNNDFKGAIIDFAKAIKLEPNNAYAHVLKGQSLSQLYRYDEALIDLNKSVELAPTYYYSYSERARVKYDMDNFKGAISDCSKSIELEPNNSSAYSIMANSKHKLKDYLGAINDYSKAIELEPYFPYCYVQRGRSKGYLGKYKEAILDCDKAINIDAEYEYAYFQRGDIKFNSKDYIGAISDLSKAIKLLPNYAKAYLVRGEVKLEFEDYRGALIDFMESNRLIPTAYSYKMLGDVNDKLNNQEEAILNYDKAIELYPNYIDALLLGGNCKADIGNYAGAEKDFMEVIELDEKNGVAYYYLASIYKGEKAVFNYTKSLESYPNFELTYFYRASAYLDIYKYDEAIDDYKKAMKLNSKKSSFYYDLMGDAESYRGNNKKAIDYYTKAIKFDSNINSFYNRALVKSSMGDEKGAISDYRAMLHLKKDNPDYKMWDWVYNNLGYNYFEINDFNNAQKYLDKAVVENKDNDGAWSSLAELYFAKGEYNNCIDAASKSIKLVDDAKVEASVEQTGTAYYFRALANIKIGNDKEMSCLDLSKAGELGYEKAYVAIKKYCNNN